MSRVHPPLQAGEATLTAAQFAEMYRVKVGTIHRWASEDDWPRSNNKHRPVRYSVLAAEASVRTRREEKSATASL